MNGNTKLSIPAGKEITSDEIVFPVEAGQTVDISMNFEGFTQMNAGTLVTGPLSKGLYAYGDFAGKKYFRMI